VLSVDFPVLESVGVLDVRCTLASHPCSAQTGPHGVEEGGWGQLAARVQPGVRATQEPPILLPALLRVPPFLFRFTTTRPSSACPSPS
jgi:hypothetical protein